jgi:branched-chain amino acid aminotransferase
MEDFYRADEVFCTGTMGELAAVTTIDNRTVGNGQIGEMTQRLSEQYARRTSSEGVPVVD